MLIRSMQETGQLTRLIINLSRTKSVGLRYLSQQQLHASYHAQRVLAGQAVVPDGWPPPTHFARQLVEPDAYEARVTQLFFARPGLVVQLALHEFVPDYWSPRRFERPGDREVRVAGLHSWVRYDGVLLDLQFRTVKEAQAIWPTVGAACHAHDLKITGIHRVDAAPVRYHVALHSTNQGSLVEGICRIAQLCDPYLAARFAGALDLACAVHPTYFPQPDEQTWGQLSPAKRTYLMRLGDVAQAA